MSQGLGWADSARKIKKVLDSYDSPFEFKKNLSDRLESLYDDVERVLFLARVLANVQNAFLGLLYTLAVGRERVFSASGQLDNLERVKELKRRVGFSRDKVKKVIFELNRLSGDWGEMTQDQWIVYKKKHEEEIKYVVDYYLNVLFQIQRMQVDEEKKKIRKNSGPRWWSWFRFTEFSDLLE